MPSVSAIEVRRVAPGEDAAAWGAAVATLPGLAPRVLKKEGHTTVLAATLRGRAVVVKQWRFSRPRDWVLWSLRASRADRHWDGAQTLERLSIRTARCFAMGLERSEVGTTAWLVMEHLEGRSVLDHLASRELSARHEQVIVDELERTLGALARARRYNRDPKPSNLIVVGVTERAAQVAMIDTVAIRRVTPWGSAEHRLDRALAMLWIEPAGCGVPPRRALALRILSRRDAHGAFRIDRERLARVLSIIDAHGDPRPRINPLGS